VQNLQLPGLKEMLKPRVFVYSMEDDVAEFPNFPSVLLNEEKRVIEQADIVTVTAHELEKRAEKMGARHVHYMPNGVDWESYRRPEGEIELSGEQLPRVGDGPVAIYVGALDEWFDEDLLVQVSEELSDWSFVLIGPPRRAFARLKELSNVFILGARQPEVVPSLLWQADAGIIPFRRTPLIESVCPLKLYEYMASGLPVISTRWREIERLESPAVLCGDAGEFAGALRVVREGDDVNREKLIQFAESYDWENIFDGFGKKIEKTLG
jgi:glycosyltransferase involved in cell wall biosynthesis